jgi:hypothetical protein
VRIYEGTPRQNWEEVLRSVGAWADAEKLKDILLLELDGGFLVQGLQPVSAGTWSESSGSLAKRILELTDEQIAELVDSGTGRRGSAASKTPKAGPENYYEQALRIIGKYLDREKPRDLFFFEQGGSFVVRLLTGGSAGGVSHQLAEFTRDEILAMIETAPAERH